MASIGGPNVIDDGLVLYLDAANEKSLNEGSTRNTVVFPSAGANRYNNTRFNGTITNTGQTFMGSPIWEVTFIPQNESLISRLGSTDGFGFFHSMGTQLFPNTEYISSVYFKTEHPLPSTPSQGFANTYSNISGWGHQSTSTTRIQEGEWTRLYTKYFNNVVINGINYSNRFVSNTLQAIVNTTQTTQVLVTVTIQANGTFSTSTDFGTSTAGGSITAYAQHEGLTSATPTITNNGGISGLSTGTSAIINHGLNTSTWTKLSTANPVLKTSYPFQYYVLMNIPSTGGVNRTVSFNLQMNGIYTFLTDNKFWKITFNTSNLQVNDVIRTYWAAPMVEQSSGLLPSSFSIGRGWVDSSGNGKNGILLNGPTFNSSNRGSIIFDGVDDVISLGTGNTFFPLPQFTIDLWFKSSGTVATTGTVPGLFGFTYGIRAHLNDTSLLFGVDNGTGITNLTTSGTFRTDNNWYNVTFYHTGTNMGIYVNGILRNSVNSAWSGTSRWPTDSWNLGRDNNNNNQFFFGQIASCKIYNKVFTAAEILQNYNATKGRFGL